MALHAAIGAASGSLTGSRLGAVAAGPMLHMAGDRVPHQHPQQEAFDLLTGVVALGLVVRRRGLLDPGTLGAFACVLPDFEHVIPRRLRPGGAKLFHRRPGRDRKDSGLTTATQLVLTGALLLPIVARRRP